MYCCSPNECPYHYQWSWNNPIVRLDKDGACPLAFEHLEFGPAAG